MAKETKAMPAKTTKAMMEVKKILKPTGLTCFVGICENESLGLCVIGKTGFIKDESVPFDFRLMVSILAMWSNLTQSEKGAIFDISCSALMREESGKEAAHG